MLVLDEIKEYAQKCISDEIISAKKHKQACQRLLDDIKSKKFIWDEERAKKIVEWFSLLNHSKGVLAGTPIILTDWQKFILCQIYGWYLPSGERRFNHSFIEVARKNAKSQMEAGVALYEISAKAFETGEIRETYCAGVKREQSKLVFNEARNMLQNPKMRKRFKITNNSISCKRTGSFLVPLSKEAGRSGDGTNPALLIIDEYHQHRTTEMLDLGLGANAKDSIIMIITTAGLDLNSPCYRQEYSYCSKILDPNSDVENDRYFVDILEIDEDDDIHNIECWHKANPIRMTYKEGRDKITSDYAEAEEVPEKMNIFITKCLNKWVQAKESGYMHMGKWKSCEVEKIPYDINGRPVYIGFDLSATIDLTSVGFVIPIKDDPSKKEEYIIYSHSFIPNRQKLIERCNIDKVPYDLWEKQGYITVTDTPIVDQDQVIDYALDFCEKNNLTIKALCFDKSYANKLMLDYGKKGYPVVEVWQSHKHLNEATTEFRNRVYEGRVLYTHNPVLNYAMTNAVIKQNNGLIKIDKDATNKRIDPVDAILFGFKLAYYHKFDTYSSFAAFKKLCESL